MPNMSAYWRGWQQKNFKKNSRESPPTQRGTLLGPVRWDLAIACAFICPHQRSLANLNAHLLTSTFTGQPQRSVLLGTTGYYWVLLGGIRRKPWVAYGESLYYVPVQLLLLMRKPSRPMQRFLPVQAARCWRPDLKGAQPTLQQGVLIGPENTKGKQKQKNKKDGFGERPQQRGA